MCRNITVLRSLDPPVTDDEVRAAATQYVRKVAALSSASALDRDDVRRAVDAIAQATAALLDALPPRRVAAPGPPHRLAAPTADEQG